MSTPSPTDPSAPPHAPLDQLADHLRPADTLSLPISECNGRIAAEPLRADRDSPAADVSAMDGYAFRFGDAQPGTALRIVGESSCGKAPPPAPGDGQAIRIFTGAVVPQGCDLVVRREDTQEPQPADPPPTNAEPLVRLGDVSFRPGQNIRRQGENGRAGDTIFAAGCKLHAGHIATAANFGATQLRVTRPLRVNVIVTGDEVLDPSQPVTPWQLRDSNGPTLAAILQHPWLETRTIRAPDQLRALTDLIREQLENCDALLLTGGVSMGDYDYVPQAVRDAGGTQVFHKLPIRPGKPLFGAHGTDGQLILGLPGNPVSAAVGARRFAIPLLQRMAGLQTAQTRNVSAPTNYRVELDQDDARTLPLVWFRLVRWSGPGRVELIESRGSGDVVGLSRSDGFIEVPPHAQGRGPWPFYSWQ